MVLRSVSGAAGSGMVFGNPFEFTAASFVRTAYIDASDIDKLYNQIKSFRVPLQIALDTVVQPAIVQNFAEQGRPGWQPLAASTLLRRQKSKHPRANASKPKIPTNSPRILDQTGFLKKIATQKNVWEIVGDQLAFRVNYFTQRVTYAGYHQLGTRKMVARPFISMTNTEESKVLEIFSIWLDERIDKYWGSGGPTNA